MTIIRFKNVSIFQMRPTHSNKKRIPPTGCGILEDHLQIGVDVSNFDVTKP